MSSSPAPAAHTSKRGEAGLTRSVGVALLLEAGVLLAAGTALSRVNAAAPPPAPVTVVLVDNPEPKHETPPEKKIEPRRVDPLVKATPVAPTPVPPPPALVSEAPPTPAPSVVADERKPDEPPPPARGDADREVEFAARLKAAIQAALVYPPAARAMRYTGRVRLEFQFRDGLISNVHVLQSGGSGMIDKAALTSVASAVMPPLPDSLRGRELSYQVTVEFSLAGR